MRLRRFRLRRRRFRSESRIPASAPRWGGPSHGSRHVDPAPEQISKRGEKDDFATVTLEQLVDLALHSPDEGTRLRAAMAALDRLDGEDQ